MALVMSSRKNSFRLILYAVVQCISATYRYALCLKRGEENCALYLLCICWGAKPHLFLVVIM
ncbi:hypothetical protein Plhal304r1_c065g0153231 [Plasmopara halstedii]